MPDNGAAIIQKLFLTTFYMLLLATPFSLFILLESHHLAKRHLYGFDFYGLDVLDFEIQHAYHIRKLIR